MPPHDGPATFACEEARPWQAWHDALLRGLQLRVIPQPFPGLTRRLRVREPAAFLDFLKHTTQQLHASPSGGATHEIWRAAFVALPPPAAGAADALWKDALVRDSQAAAALSGALDTPWEPTTWPSEGPLHPLGAPTAVWAYRALDSFQRQALILGWGGQRPTNPGLFHVWTRLLHRLDERLDATPVAESAWRLLARQAWWSMAAGFEQDDAWHRGALATPDLGQPQAGEGGGLQQLALLDTPVLCPTAITAATAWRSLGEQVFAQAMDHHLGRGPMAAFVDVPAQRPRWFRLVLALRRAHRVEGPDRFLDPEFEHAMARWTAAVTQRASKAGVPGEYQPTLGWEERQEAWARVLLQAPDLWQSRFRQWGSEDLAPLAIVNRRTRLRS